MEEALGAIAGEIARRADDFLAGVQDRARARTEIADLLTLDYPGLDATARAAIINAVMRALAEEDFFGIEFVGDAFAELDDNEEE